MAILIFKGSASAANTASAIPLALVFLVVAAAAWLAHRHRRLSHIPGPFWAQFTNVPRFRWAWSDKIQEKHIALHRQYGDVVRIGPNCVSVGSPAAISRIYGTASNFQKSNFYRVLQPMAHGRVMQGLFNTQDDKLHRSLKRPIAGIYSMTNLVSFEPYVDATMGVFFERLEQEQRSQAALGSDATSDLGSWLLFFAFDVMGEITFSKRFGFLDTASDVDGIIGDIYKFFAYTHAVGQMPMLDWLGAKNPVVSWLRPAKTSAVVAFAQTRAKERQAAACPDKADEYNARDFMSRFIETRLKDPSIPEGFLTAWSTSNVQAGSDTTAILLRAIVHFLLTNPASLAKLRAELRLAQQEGRLSASGRHGVVTWKESRELPYLDACVKEASRLHAPVGVTMERVVKTKDGLGVEVCGTHVPDGTVVGMNAWVVHRDRGIFGADADQWNPDRWMGPKDERRTAMERSLLTFGAGHRTCIGKNVSYLEIYKLIPTLFARYDITLATPEKWGIVNHWLVFQNGLHVRITPRDEEKEGSLIDG